MYIAKKYDKIAFKIVQIILYSICVIIYFCFYIVIMHITFSVIRTFLAGTWLLMFWLFLFEESVTSLGGKKLKKLLDQQTKTISKWLWAGTRISWVTTSSTFVTLLLVAFVGWWFMSLQHAMPVILGANIWTTINSLLVAYVWFWGFKISALALPIISFWWIIHMVTKNKKRLDIAHIAIWLGLLFLGLEYMKSSIEVIAHNISFEDTKSLFIYGIMWFSITALLHSQSAMSLIALSALHAWIINLPATFAIIIGANVWTTMTAIVASFSGSRVHKQVAMAHFLQNVWAACIWILFFNQFMWLCTVRLANILWYSWNNVLAAARFNMVFNVLTAIPFLFWIPYLEKILAFLIPVIHKKNRSFYIDKLRWIEADKGTISIQLDSMIKDCIYLHKELNIYIHCLLHKKIDANNILQPHQYTQKEQESIYETFIHDIEHLYIIFVWLQTVATSQSNQKKCDYINKSLSLLLDEIREYESISPLIEVAKNESLESFQHIYKLIEAHFISPEDENIYIEIKYSFINIINEIVTMKNKWDTDLASLLSLQHSIEQLHTLRNKIQQLHN